MISSTGLNMAVTVVVNLVFRASSEMSLSVPASSFRQSTTAVMYSLISTVTGLKLLNLIATAVLPARGFSVLSFSSNVFYMARGS